jgi:hypothetical protein
MAVQIEFTDDEFARITAIMKQTAEGSRNMAKAMTDPAFTFPGGIAPTLQQIQDQHTLAISDEALYNKLIA